MQLCRLFMILGALATLALLTLAAASLPWQLLAVAAAAVAVRNSKKDRGLFSGGTAAWADAGSLERAGMIGGGGLCVGVVAPARPSLWRAARGLLSSKIPSRQACEDFAHALRNLKRHPVEVRLNHVIHTAVVAPTGSGKGVSLILPFLLECKESCVVIDPKGENARVTADARRAMGHQVVVLDPFKIVTDAPDTLNVLDAVCTDSPTALDDCRAIANQLVQRTGSEPDPHWNDAAESMITALIAVTLFLDGKDRSLQTVRRLLTDTERRATMLRHMAAVGDWDGMLARACLQVLNYEGKELAGILSTANRHMNFLDTPAVAESTRASSFGMAELLKRMRTLYLVLPPQYLDSHSGLLRLWVGASIRACMHNGLQERNKVHFVLDEAASLGKLDILRHAVDKLRGYGARLQFYFQSLAQVKSVWPDGQDQTFLSNVTLVTFGSQDKETCEYVSAMLGKETIVVESEGTNAGTSASRNTTDAGGNLGTSRGGSRNYSQQARELLQPDEVRNLSPLTAITFTPGAGGPIATTLRRYYEPRPRHRPIRTTLRIWAAGLGLLGLSSTALWVWVTLTFHHR